MTIRLGIVGTGQMANWHALRFGQLKGVRITACCDSVEERARVYAEKNKIPGIYADLERMLETEKLDGIVNVTPDSVHEKVAVAVLARRIPLLSEKPMAANLSAAGNMLEAAKKAGVPAMVNFSYRYSSGLQQARKLIATGRIGNIMHVEVSYLQGWLASVDWRKFKSDSALAWRMSTRHGSMGVVVDLGSHAFDMASFVAGDVSRLICTLKTADKGIPGNRIGEYVLDSNDSFMSSVQFKNGALGKVFASRIAVGHQNSIRVAIGGSAGAIEIDFDKSPGEYRICRKPRTENDKAEWKTVACRKMPDNQERFLAAIRTGKNDESDFVNGVKIQSYLDACLRSGKSDTWAVPGR
jgi:predicted dehydrogenase